MVKKYTARWFFNTFSGMAESTTEAEFSSYKYPNTYNGGLETAGEGELMWRGRPRCGARSGRQTSGAGVVCYGQDSGSPNSNPDGGSGCKERLGYRWGGVLHWWSACLVSV
jgi:hypothetical protein